MKVLGKGEVDLARSYERINIHVRLVRLDLTRMKITHCWVTSINQDLPSTLKHATLSQKTTASVKMAQYLAMGFACILRTSKSFVCLHQS